ncbi:hypothetical protein [Sporomusa aerivorans]|uniref:hypothetical protein n=1 Tax=Sporomusa aerivorans TaxID=204936 RepID=UPI00352A4AAC
MKKFMLVLLSVTIMMLAAGCDSTGSTDYSYEDYKNQNKPPNFPDHSMPSNDVNVYPPKIEAPTRLPSKPIDPPISREPIKTYPLPNRDIPIPKDPPKINIPNAPTYNKPIYIPKLSSAEIDNVKLNKIAYLKAYSRYVASEYGMPDNISTLSYAQKASLQAALVNLKSEVSTWQEFDKKEIRIIHSICDKYLSQME